MSDGRKVLLVLLGQSRNNNMWSCPKQSAVILQNFSLILFLNKSVILTIRILLKEKQFRPIKQLKKLFSKYSVSDKVAKEFAGGSFDLLVLLYVDQAIGLEIFIS